MNSTIVSIYSLQNSCNHQHLQCIDLCSTRGALMLPLRGHRTHWCLKLGTTNKANFIPCPLPTRYCADTPFPFSGLLGWFLSLTWILPNLCHLCLWYSCKRGGGGPGQDTTPWCVVCGVVRSQRVFQHVREQCGLCRKSFSSVCWTGRSSCMRKKQTHIPLMLHFCFRN